MAKATNSPDEQSNDTPEQPAATPIPVVVPPPVHPGAEFRRRKRAEHEAAHVVVTDDLGWEVTLADLNHMRADWGDFEDRLGATIRANAPQWEAITPDLLKYVTILVAGHLWEHELDPAEDIVSKRLEDNPGVLVLGQNGKADRDRTAYFLKFIQCNQLGQVVVLEERAREILVRRADHHRAVADFLFAHGKIGGDDLRNALGKPNP